MTTHVITLWRVKVTSLATSVQTMRFLIEFLSILQAIKSHFKGSYDKQNKFSILDFLIAGKVFPTSKDGSALKREKQNQTSVFDADREIPIPG